MSLNTPLSRARGLGSAKGGTHHWWMQRVTAIALVPLAVWFVGSLVCVAGGDHAGAVAWIGRPFNSVLLIAFLFATFYHAALGLQVVIEDYVHGEWAKLGSLLAAKFVLWLLCAAAILAVVRVAVGG